MRNAIVERFTFCFHRLVKNYLIHYGFLFEVGEALFFSLELQLCMENNSNKKTQKRLGK